MVLLSEVQASNLLIRSSLPARLVGVFVGATSGIGLATLRQFAKHAHAPRAYIIGRSQAAASLIISECKTLNAFGEYTFIKADVSLIRAVDNVCKQIADLEKSVNILFLSAGVIDLSRTRTAENLDLTLALTIYARARFIVNLLPLLQQAPALRRVVTVFAGTKEGPLFADDLGCQSVSLLNIRAARGHMCTMIDFCLEHIAQGAPTVSFVHDYPGFVDTGIFEKTEGVLAAAIRGVGKVADLVVKKRKERYVPLEECGERHLFLATSARFESKSEVCGVPCTEKARSSCGDVGGGVYVVDEQLESAGTEVEMLLKQMRQDGMVEVVWKHIEGEFERIARLNGDLECKIDS